MTQASICTCITIGTLFLFLWVFWYKARHPYKDESDKACNKFINSVREAE